MRDWAPNVPVMAKPQLHKLPKFAIGDSVFKWTGDYTGPGVVRGISHNSKGQVRYMVGHTIIGGTGEFLHVYAEGNLRPPEPSEEADRRPRIPTLD